MKQLTRYRRSAIAICLITCCAVLLTRCINRQSEELAGVKKVNFSQFAGSASCAGCHKNIYDTHINTAHYNSSQPASAKTLMGSFEPGKNSFAFSAHTVVSMEKRDSSFYQVAYSDGVEKAVRRFDIVIGSGTKGQTSVYWHNRQLYQLPITYFTPASQWSNSPGFPMKAVFNRPITSRCMECHSTYINTISAPGKEPESFDAGTIVYGIDCEKCHGPAAAHVVFQTSHPAEKQGKFIINPASFSRQQQLDACALCHGGRLQKTTPSFEFIAGDRLADYFTLDTTAPNPENIDLHGNQYGLMRASKCFKMSEVLTCNSCHNPHEKEKGKLELFSQRCTSCHTTAEHGNGKLCTMTASLGKSITANCIDCHMPAKPSKAIAVFLPGHNAPTAALIRSHFISIYADETKKFMEKKKAAGNKQ
ncbi:MAG: multiheme c-type cytochrome [Chitinophagaceae bacterium]